MFRTLFFSVILGSATLFCYHTLISAPVFATMSTTSWSSPFASWHSRALLERHPNPHAFTPNRDKLLLAVLLNGPVEHDGITLTLFAQSEQDSGSIAVDALGRVLLVSDKDTEGILSLAKEALNLPSTGTFRNTWVIQHLTTSQPIDRLLIPTSASGSDLHEISVQGFSKENRQLKSSVEGTQTLPKVLWELMGLVLEARDGAGYGERKDEVVLDKVREIVKSHF